MFFLKKKGNRCYDIGHEFNLLFNVTQRSIFFREFKLIASAPDDNSLLYTN